MVKLQLNCSRLRMSKGGRSVVARQVVDHQRTTELRGLAVVEGSEDDRCISERVRESCDFGVGRAVVAGEEDDAPSTLVRNSRKHGRRQGIKTLDDTSARYRLGNDLRREAATKVLRQEFGKLDGICC